MSCKTFQIIFFGLVLCIPLTILGMIYTNNYVPILTPSFAVIITVALWLGYDYIVKRIYREE